MKSSYEGISTAQILSIGCNKTDLKNKLILDYEKLYEGVCYNRLFSDETHKRVADNYKSKLVYVGYLFMYFYGLSIEDFVNLTSIETKVKNQEKERKESLERIRKKEIIYL